MLECTHAQTHTFLPIAKVIFPQQGRMAALFVRVVVPTVDMVGPTITSTDVKKVLTENVVWRATSETAVGTRCVGRAVWGRACAHGAQFVGLKRGEVAPRVRAPPSPVPVRTAAFAAVLPLAVAREPIGGVWQRGVALGSRARGPGARPCAVPTITM
jgi:hypothetical protein